MADLTASVSKPGVGGAAISYVAVSAEDTFDAQANASYILHYKNGATPTGGAAEVEDVTTPIPPGSDAVAGFANAVVIPDAGLAASAERVARIPNSNRFRDENGQITLVHNGTLTTLTVAILGPFPAGG